MSAQQAQKKEKDQGSMFADESTPASPPDQQVGAVDALNERAKMRQKERREAPTMVGGHGFNFADQKDLQRRFAPETIPAGARDKDGKPLPPEYQAGWYKPFEVSSHCDMGWEIVKDDFGKPVQKPGGQVILMRIPYDLWKGDIDAIAQRSKKMTIARSTGGAQDETNADHSALQREIVADLEVHKTEVSLKK
jgi:hypothetical protein